jgi:hypothetical protein
MLRDAVVAGWLWVSQVWYPGKEKCCLRIASAGTARVSLTWLGRALTGAPGGTTGGHCGPMIRHRDICGGCLMLLVHHPTHGLVLMNMAALPGPLINQLAAGYDCLSQERKAGYKPRTPTCQLRSNSPLQPNLRD